MTIAYKRKVSFDSLAPFTPTEPDDPPYIPPQYATKRKKALDLSYGFDSKPKVDVNDLFDSFNQIPYGRRPSLTPNMASTSAVPTKAPKLPPPPKKSILKVSDKGCALNLVGDNEASRKKSLVDMTPEELMAMDSQFRKGVSLEKLKFDGDGYLPMQNLTKLESNHMSMTTNVDKFIGTTVNNKNVLTPSIANYNSYSTTFTHEGMNSYIQDHLHKLKSMSQETLPKNESTLNEELPPSLRDLAVYISGRRHTWSALDWTLKQVVKDGDHLVIIAQIPEKVALDPVNYYGGYRASTNESDDPSDSDKKLPPYDYLEVDEVYGSEGIRDEAHRIVAYAFKFLESLGRKELKISVTVELIREADVEKLLNKAFTLYTPDLFIASTMRVKYNALSAKNKRIPFYASTKLCVPTVVIPSTLVDDSLISMEKSTKTTPFKSISDLNGFLDSMGDDDETFKYETPVKNAHSRYIFDPYSAPLVCSNTSTTTDTTASEANDPSDYLGLVSTNSTGRIKFMDNLQTPKSGAGMYGNGSRRNSHGSGVYKVKSLLDADPTPVERSKSYSSPMTNSISNGSAYSAGKKIVGPAIKQVKSDSQVPTEKKKKGLFGLFKRKK